MLRMIMAFCLFFLFGSQAAIEEPIQPAPPSAPSAAFSIYQPLIHKAARLEVVETARGEDIGYPTYYYVYGYVRNLTTEPLYDVTVDLEVTMYPYCDPSQDPSLCDDPYTYIEYIKPALTASLPGQLNPFSYSLLLGKASAYFGPIVGYSASPWSSGERQAALTSVEIQYAGTTLSGTVRNDNSQALHGNRVVAFGPGRCAWREAVLEADTLQPGGETGFHIDSYAAGCVTEDVVIAGQGAFQP